MAMREELETLAAVCRNKDIHVLYENNVDYMMRNCGDVWEFVKDYYEETKQVPDPELLETRFKDFDVLPTTAPTIYYVNRLKETYMDESLRNTLRKAASLVQENQTAKALDTLNSDISTISRVASRVKDIDVTDISETLAYFEKVREEAERGPLGIKTGIASFDVCLPMGIAPGMLGILLAYPSIGKSWMALYMAVKAWEAGRVPMIVSLEMTEQEVRNRILTIIGNGTFSHREISSGRVDQEQFKSWADKFLTGRPPFKIISSDGLSEVNPSVIGAKIDQYKPDVVFIDYLQLMTDNGRSDNETVKIKNLSREFKLLAIGRHIPIVAIASATPDDATDLESVPQLGQVAWSKQIAYDADWMLALGRKANSPVLECAFRKNRNGYMGDFGLDVNFDKGVFTEIFDPMGD